jgi:hypothetical protein
LNLFVGVNQTSTAPAIPAKEVDLKRMGEFKVFDNYGRDTQ